MMSFHVVSSGGWEGEVKCLYLCFLDQFYVDHTPFRLIGPLSSVSTLSSTSDFAFALSNHYPSLCCHLILSIHIMSFDLLYPSVVLKLERMLGWRVCGEIQAVLTK